MTRTELFTRLKDIEWDDFEVKEAVTELPKNIWESVSAFSNTSGGWIVLGVKQMGKKFEIIEFQNAGRFMFDLKDLKVQMHSMPRNPILIKLFRFAKLSENAGYGIDKMLTWEKLTNCAVEFSSDVASSTVTYFRTISVEDVQNVTEKSSQKILAIMTQNPRITTQEIADELEISRRAVAKHIANMIKKGLLTRIGPDKGGYWKVVESSNKN
ncbi:MAG: winged helix-turn-helix transcriptional regulator [Bacteroidales bacterium]|nr:winged helix-turn-helix transcriptional regulator [Bacteroidales bacterium]